MKMEAETGVMQLPEGGGGRRDPPLKASWKHSPAHTSMLASGLQTLREHISVILSRLSFGYSAVSSPRM